MALVIFALWVSATLSIAADSRRFFAIQVVDEATGRGVPLAQLRTVNEIVWWTDSAGWAAIDEPGLMGLDVFYFVSSPGYEFPQDGFDFRGTTLRTAAGKQAQLKLKRTQIAERLYRVTGEGIYRDSVLLGNPTALRRPVLNGEVLGQDTVITAPYRGKLYWFWGDTSRARYPLGNFGASGSTSEWPGRGGLDPAVGVNLTYFTNRDGFSKPMCPDASFGEGLKWIEGVVTLRDENGREQLLARVAAGTGMTGTREWHLARFNDQSETFESLLRWDLQATHDSAHPFRARAPGGDYFYWYPNFRVRAELRALSDLSAYESFTCLGGDGKYRGAETPIDRDASGRPRYSWKAGADRLHSGILRELVASGVLRRSELWLQLIDVESGQPVEGGRGSVYWSEFLGRWLMIISGHPGEIWFSAADTPTGPWVFARRVAVHDRYNFYNPTQHPYFDQEGGRVVFFEGTYTEAFSGAPAKTPRYDYNQIMYRLRLDDARLALPQPVYRMKAPGEGDRWLLREEVAAEDAWDEIESIAFFAVPSRVERPGLIPVFRSTNPDRWQTNAPSAGRRPLFWAQPLATDASLEGSANSLTYEILHDAAGKPLGRVWSNPVTTLTLDPRVQPVP